MSFQLPETEEEVAVCWGKMLIELAETHGAPNFAWHMAEKGCTAENVREFAESWEKESYDPPEVAGHMREMADALFEIAGAEGRTWLHGLSVTAAADRREVQP